MYSARAEAGVHVWAAWVCSPQASNIDDVLGHHTSFLDTCLKDCMLTNPELLKVFSKLMSVCVMFTNCMQVRPPPLACPAPSVLPEPRLAVLDTLPHCHSVALLKRGWLGTCHKPGHRNECWGERGDMGVCQAHGHSGV